MRGVLAVEAAGAAASSASVLNGAVDWWRDVNESPLWQDRIFHALAVLYGIVSAVALVSTPPHPTPPFRYHEPPCGPISPNCAMRWCSARLSALG